MLVEGVSPPRDGIHFEVRGASLRMLLGAGSVIGLGGICEGISFGGRMRQGGTWWVTVDCVSMCAGVRVRLAWCEASAHGLRLGSSGLGDTRVRVGGVHGVAVWRSGWVALSGSRLGGVGVW